MQKGLFFIFFSFFVFFSGNVFSEGEHGHGHEHGKQSVTGEVVDVTCYLSHPESGIGKGHARCAYNCIKKGLPVAIKQGDTLYIAVGSKHKPANKMLVDYAAKNVKATGKVMQHDGLNMIEIESVKVVE